MNLSKCHCCKTNKPLCCFYENGRRICRRCNRARVKRWTLAHPNQARANGKRYRTSVQGRRVTARRRHRWRPLNTAADAARHARYIARLPDAYIRNLLKWQSGITNPTTAVIEQRRRRVQIMRARRTLALLHHGY